MLGIALVYNTIDNIDKKKKIITSYIVIALLIFSGLLSSFIYMDQTNVEANPGTVCSHDFETGLLQDNWEYYNDTGQPVVRHNYAPLVHSGTWAGNVTDTGAARVALKDLTDTWNDNNFSLCLYINCSSFGSTDYTGIFSIRNLTTNDDIISVAFEQNGGSCYPRMAIVDEGGATVDVNNTSFSLSLNQWHNITLISNYSNATHSNLSLVVDGTEYVSSSWQHGDEMNTVYIGSFGTSTMQGTYSMDDFLLVDEVWPISGSGGYPTINDAVFNASLTNVDGVYSITFNGTQGETVWCNDSGTGRENMTVSINDGNQSVSWINVTLTDIGTTPDCDAEDFYLYASESVGSGYVAISSFPIGGGNVTVNATTWTGVDPFPIEGSDTVYFRFKWTIDADQTNQTYTETGCKVWIGG